MDRHYVAEGLSRRYGGVHALVNADLVLRAGEVHALLGANGAGKSTLVKILAGAEQPSEGTLALDGERVSFANTEEAARAGVALVSQELNLFPDLDALQNLFLLREPRLAGVLLDRREMRRRAAAVSEVIGYDLDLDRKVADLRLGERQLLEIGRALLGEPSILILDEPTSALQAEETARLLKVIETLRDRGVAIVFVSHFLEDVFQITDKVTILRGGRVVVGDHPAARISVSETIREMLGEVAWQHARALQAAASEARLEATADEPGADTEDGEELEVVDVSIPGVVEDVSFKAASGSVVGLAGLEGSGAQAMMRHLFGAGRRRSAGSVTLPGGRPGPRSMSGAVRAGVAFVPADRKDVGLLLDKSIAENIALVNGGPLRRMGMFLGRRRMSMRAEVWRDRLRITMASPAAPVDSLSGGNQQKVVFAKWLETEPRVILLDDPTRGVDIGAKLEMQRLMREIAAEGRIVIYTSSDFEEMAEVCDRVLVFFGGRIRAELQGGLSEHELLEAVNTGSALVSAG